MTASEASHLVVVVEDEFLVRLAACEALADAGFQVVEVDRSDGAIAVLRSRAIDIHALFTDVHVPGPIDGIALAHLARRNWPWMALLLASGRARPHSSELPDGSRFMSKPYEACQVIGHLREMVSALSSVRETRTPL